MVFKEMLHCELNPDRAYFIGREGFLNWDISGLIALTGEVTGLVALSMKYPTAQKLTGLMTGAASNISNADMVDAVGELINIIAGNVKKSLEDLFKIIISLPKVVNGKAHFIVIPDDRTRLLCIPFKIFEDDILCLSINIKEG